MTTRNQLRAEGALAAYTRRHKPQLLTGSLGNNSGTIAHPTRTNWWYVRLHGDPNQVILALRVASVPDEPNIVVALEKVERRAVSFYQIVGLAANIVYPGNDYYGTVGAHAEQHQRRDLGESGFDPLDVYTRALVGLRARAQAVPDDTLYVEVGWYDNAGQRTKWTGGNSPAFSIPVAAPLTLTRRCDLLYMGNDDALHIETGTATTDGTLPGYPATPTDCCAPLAMVFLDSTMTAITEDYIEDCRALGASSVGTVLDTTTIFDLETEHRFIVVGHRGDINAVDGYPENTIAAFLSAARKGAQRVEMDVYLTADGSWYVMHDATVDRTTDGSGNVSAKTDAQMDALNIDGGYGYRAAHAGLYHPPSLESVLDALNPYGVTLQIENYAGAGTNDDLATYLLAQGWKQRVVLNAATQAEAQEIESVDPTFAIMGAVGITAWSEIDIVQYRYGDPTTADPSEATILAAAPRPVSVYISAADYGIYDEGEVCRIVYQRGARYFTTNDLNAALPEWRKLICLQSYMADNEDVDEYPVAPNALDDEFEGEGAIDGKWTKTNDPAGSDALSQAIHKGFLYVGLAELGTDDFDNLVRMHQTPPTGTAAMEYVVRAAIACTGHLGGEGGEFASVGVYLGNSVDDEATCAVVQINYTAAAYQAELACAAAGNQVSAGSIAAMSTSEFYRSILPGQFVYLKLSKATANAYTAANTYNAYISGDGLIWHQVGTTSFTFTTACDEVGVMFRRPKSQGGTPKAEALIDFFRRVV